MNEETKCCEQEYSVQNPNSVSKTLTVIAWFIFTVGILAGFGFTTVSVVAAIIYWCATLIFTTMFFGFAEMIQLLQDIKNK